MTKRLTQEEFVSRVRNIHGDKYDYSKIKYINAQEKVDVVCPIHGVFSKRGFTLLKGQGCPLCSREQGLYGRNPKTTEQFIKEAKSIHGEKYIYDKTCYTHSYNKVIITCPIHGDFEQLPFAHIIYKQGCPLCANSKGEDKIYKYLKSKDVEFIRQYKVPNENIFAENKSFHIDFYLPKSKIAIEYNGIQHYKQTDYFHHKNLEKQQERDMALRQYCKEHKIKLIEIPYWDYDNIETILNKELKIK